MNTTRCYTCNICGWLFPEDELIYDPEFGGLICRNCKASLETLDDEQESYLGDIDFDWLREHYEEVRGNKGRTKNGHRKVR